MMLLWFAVVAGGSLEYVGFAAPTTNVAQATRLVLEYAEEFGLHLTPERGVEALECGPVVDLGQWMRARVTRPE